MSISAFTPVVPKMLFSALLRLRKNVFIFHSKNPMTPITDGNGDSGRHVSMYNQRHRHS